MVYLDLGSKKFQLEMLLQYGKPIFIRLVRLRYLFCSSGGILDVLIAKSCVGITWLIKDL